MKNSVLIYIIISFLLTESAVISNLFAQNLQNDQKQQPEIISENTKEQTQEQKNIEDQTKLDETNKPVNEKHILSAPEIRATKGDFTDKIEIRWNNIPEADKYFIFRSINKEEFTELYQTQSFVFADSNVEPGKIYYYKIKAWSKKLNCDEVNNP